MNKREAKQTIYTFLVYHLDMAIIADFIIAESKDNQKDLEHLWDAVNIIRDELDRKAGNDAQAKSSSH